MKSEEENPIHYYNPNGRMRTSPYRPLIYALILSVGVLIGFVINNATSGKREIFSRGYDKIDDIINYINIKYVDTVNREQLVDKTIDKMLSNLDPHSVYITAKSVDEMNEPLEGNFEGIGIEFFIVQDTITVVSAISGGPSESIGLKAGDRILKINDSIVAGIKISETGVKQRLRGHKGTTVKVTVLRSGMKNLLNYEIVRDKIPLYSIDASYMINKQTGYIRIGSFSATTHEEFMERVEKMKAEGMKKMIIDLRGNPGGYLQAATAIADELISGDKLLVYTEGKAYERQEYHANKIGIFEEGALSILIDQGSASASEILSGAVQDWDRGTIIGRTSFGKGLVQEQYALKDGSALRLTVARYYTPSGRSIQRSYANGNEQYYNEIYERYMRGEFVHEDTVKIQDTVVYRTGKGRRVFGGGGIRPDVFVPVDTSADNEYYYMVRSFVPEFVYKYTSENSGLLDKFKSPADFQKDFQVNEELLNAFYRHAAANGLKEDSKKIKLIDDKIKKILKAFLAKQAWRMDGYYYIMNEDDKVISKAIEVMQ
ncbi:MAG: S41 family peptidase [Bacteroidetes bacterium]|nr:S41 family peptidase [Bacteroidota bacterium]